MHPQPSIHVTEIRSWIANRKSSALAVDCTFAIQGQAREATRFVMMS